MNKIAMILRKAPYGDVSAAEAVRHAMGGATEELAVNLILIDSGVFLAKKGHDDAGTGFTNLESVLKDCMDLGVAAYADKDSLRAQHVEGGDVVEGVKVIDAAEIARMVKEAKTTMIF